MLTQKDRTTPESPAAVDTRPALRRVADRYSHWWVASVLVFGVPAVLIAVAAAPAIAVLALVGLAATTLRYVAQRDWAALRHIISGIVLVAVGYVTARVFVHLGVPSVHEWITTTRDRSDVYASAGAHGRSVLLAFGALGAWVVSGVGLLVGGACTLYALIRPYRTRFSPRVVLGACAAYGAAVGLVG